MGLILVWALSSGVFAQGPLDVSVPAWGNPLPNYYSGTNCRANGSAEIGEQILYGCLYINDELVKEYSWHSGDAEVIALELGCMFDSSHFAPGTAITVSMGVYGDATGWTLGLLLLDCSRDQ
jgi:hypothetical protein